MTEAATTQFKVVVVGGGNSTPIFATLAKDAGHHVSVLTRKPEAWNKDDCGFNNEDEGYLGGKTSLRVSLDCVTSDPAECIPDADMIFIAGLPIHHNPEVLGRIRPHLNKEKKVMVGSICAYGGFNWVAAKALGKGNYVIFGAQLIPWCCGTVKYGETGVVFGAKRMLRIATEGGKDEDGVKDVMKKILKIDDLKDTDFIASCLWPNNPSIHPPILYGLFKDFDGKTPYKAEDVPNRIYAEMTDTSSKYMEDMDKELQDIVGALRVKLPANEALKLDFHLKHCVEENYLEQVKDKTSMASTFRTNVAFGKHNIPYTTVEGGVIPTLKHKFFETDLPFGLLTWKDIADMVGVKVPLVEAIIIWNQKLIGKEYLAEDGALTGSDLGECILPSRMGLTAETLEYGNRDEFAVETADAGDKRMAEAEAGVPAKVAATAE